MVVICTKIPKIEQCLKLFTLRKIQSYITQRVSVLLYKQFILPILDYADFLFDSTVKCELDRVQKRTLRLIGLGQINNRAIESSKGTAQKTPLGFKG